MEGLDKKILVIGGAGFVGSYIVRALLDRGYKNIRISKRKNSRIGLIHDLQNSIEIVETDVNDISGLNEAMEGIDWVIHAAALVSFVASERKEMFKSNVEGTANVVNVCLEKGIEKLAYVSSVAALGRKRSGQIIDENSKWETGKLNTQYALSKHLAEIEVWRGIQEGLTAYVICPSIILGAAYWDSGSVNIITKLAGYVPYYPPGKTTIVDVRDVADMLLQLMVSDRHGERFICSGHTLSYRELFTKLARALGSRAPRRALSPFIAQLAWRFYAIKSKLTGQRPTITKESMRTSFHSFEYSNAKSKEELNFLYRDLETTISDISIAYKESKQNNMDYGILK